MSYCTKELFLLALALACKVECNVLNTLPRDRHMHHFQTGAHPQRQGKGTVKVPWSAPVAGFFSWMVSEGKSTKGSSCHSISEAEAGLMYYK